MQSKIEKNFTNSDAIEAATCALTNLLSLHTPNAHRLFAVGGVEVLFELLRLQSCTDLLDADKAMQTQAHITNTLANLLATIGENSCFLEAAFLHGNFFDFNSPKKIDSGREASLACGVVMSCAASLSTARHAASLLIGNLACNSKLRSELGRLGAIEALWASTKKN